MKREVLFRGKRKDNGEWFEGCFVDGKYIIGYFECNDIDVEQSLMNCMAVCREVSLDSVGQFTNRIDGDRLKIFEGDILKVEFNRHGNWQMDDSGEDGFSIGCVHYQPSKGFVIKNIFEVLEHGEIRKINCVREFSASRSKVIGNITDNKELLKLPESYEEYYETL